MIGTMSNSAAGPTKQDIEAVFHRLRAQPANKACFDCSAKAPTWSSVTYGIFICIDCSAVHRNLGVHLTFVRSTNLDTNWTWLQLRQMQLGGNANAAQFFRQHNCVTTDAQQKYNSRAAQLYRDKLAAMAQQAMKVHGTKLHLENTADKADGNESKSTTDAEEDFFAECINDNNKKTLFENNNSEQEVKLDILPKAITPTLSNDKPSTESLSGGAPSVDFLNSVVPPTAVTPSIGVRKIQPKKSGLGARKGGLGATKVKTNFAEIEQRANLANQCKEAPIVSDKTKSAEEEQESVASMRLAYKDLSIQKKREEDKLKSIDPAKAKQMERLGMGFSLRGADVSHSALSDMETIKQTSAPKNGPLQNKSSNIGNSDDLADIDSVFGEYSCALYIDNIGIGGGRSGSSAGKSSKIDKSELEMMGFESIESIGGGHSNITSMFAGGDGDAKPTKTTKPAQSAGAYASKSQLKNVDDTSAQQKFGSAKGFGSDQFFANDANQLESRKANLSRFQNSDSISSSEYFGGSRNGPDGLGNRDSRGYATGVNFQAPDLDDVKESVRQGVHKVAGRLSSIANDVMSSIQDKYGY
ncbi:PREDICTED: ADP-ribosylation factor GTPase-activating protein 2 [Rhagoletis zephyria]|uniref:ADP-ribosylation factor GTPase-activating protein 2 n=1 Tax=Rhagoletis zephyria TaxID=28612 RepID=UPI000811A5C4|nr:PREDICTED: ADP-ribosylation factor GTPase-activating protein 2 [Rhagoletis zephyria]